MRSRAIARRRRHSGMAAGARFWARSATPSGSLAAVLHAAPGRDLMVFPRRLFVVSGAEQNTSVAERNGGSACAWTGMLLAMIVDLAIIRRVFLGLLGRLVFRRAVRG